MKFFFALLVMLFVALPVTAQINTQKNNQAVTTNKYIVDPNQKISPPASPRNNESPDQKVTRVYASHVLTALCAQNVMVKFRDVNWTPAQKSSFWKQYQTGCRCLSNEILTVVDPAEVVDFARYTFAEQSEGLETNVNMKRIDAISTLYSSPQLLKKCGLPQ